MADFAVLLKAPIAFMSMMIPSFLSDCFGGLLCFALLSISSSGVHNWRYWAFVLILLLHS
jgi:hypothetical protein